MSVPLEEPRAPATPSLKLREIGQWADLALVSTRVAPLYVYNPDSTAPAVRKITASGKEATQDVVTGVVIAGTATLVADGAERVVEPGDLVAVWIAGHSRFDPDFDRSRAKGEPKSWGGAKEDHAPNVGDKLRVRYEAEVPGKGSVPKRVRTFKTGPNPDGALVDKCLALNAAAKGRPLDAQPSDELEPF